MDVMANSVPRGAGDYKACPRIRVEMGTETFWVLAEELDDNARAGLWPKLIAEYPAIGEFQARTGRQIPVFMLTRARCS
jgi:hypothetical protein